MEVRTVQSISGMYLTSLDRIKFPQLQLGLGSSALILAFQASLASIVAPVCQSSSQTFIAQPQADNQPDGWCQARAMLKRQV